MTPTTVAHTLLTGFRMTMLSFEFVKKHAKLLLYAALTPLLTIVATPLLFRFIIQINRIPTPEWVYSFLFSFIGLIIFNIVYAGLINYCFQLFEGKHPGLTTCIRLKKSTIVQVLAWAFISACIGTFYDMLVNQWIPSSFVTNIVIKIVDIFWWLINFLIIPAIVDGTRSFVRSMTWTVQSIIKSPLIVIGTGGSLLLIKYAITLLIFQIITYTLGFLAKFNLIETTPADGFYIFMVLVPVIGLLSSAVISIIVSTAEALVATGLYLRIMGRPVHQLERATYKHLLIIGATLFALFALFAFVIAGGLTLLSFKVPAIKMRLISFLS